MHLLVSTLALPCRDNLIPCSCWILLVPASAATYVEMVTSLFFFFSCEITNMPHLTTLVYVRDLHVCFQEPSGGGSSQTVVNCGYSSIGLPDPIGLARFAICLFLESTTALTH